MGQNVGMEIHKPYVEEKHTWQLWVIIHTCEHSLHS